ncbi:hypothetical protein [Tateyamaria sp.]|uniref:hypothetical protein n=1 Tax=Tateyamaria sp. TaxID=1929288 RepID=UPI00329E82D3
MKKLILIATLGLCTPALAQEQAGDGLSLMERGAQILLEGLMREMEPALDGVQGWVEEFGPALRGLLDEVEDWSSYTAPEMLENGDIIIRRKPTAEKDQPAPDENGQIDL